MLARKKLCLELSSHQDSWVMANRYLCLFIFWGAVAILSSCSHSDSVAGELERRRFTDDRIVGVHLEKRQRLSTREHYGFCREVLDLLRKAAPGRDLLFWDDQTVMELSLMTGSSFESEVLKVKVNPDGDGKVMIGRGKPRHFYSPALAKLLEKQPAYHAPRGFPCSLRQPHIRKP